MESDICACYWFDFEEEEKAGCFAIIVLQMYCYYKWSVALPHGAVHRSAVCDCVFPDHTHLQSACMTLHSKALRAERQLLSMRVFAKTLFGGNGAALGGRF